MLRDSSYIKKQKFLMCYHSEHKMEKTEFHNDISSPIKGLIKKNKKQTSQSNLELTELNLNKSSGSGLVSLSSSKKRDIKRRKTIMASKFIF